MDARIAGTARTSPRLLAEIVPPLNSLITARRRIMIQPGIETAACFFTFLIFLKYLGNSKVIKKKKKLQFSKVHNGGKV